jgi:prevent-host-death family protein
MPIVNMLAAKTNLSRLIEQIEAGTEREIIIARNGKPAARLVPLEAVKPKFPKRLGLVEGRYATYSQEEFDAVNDRVVVMFGLPE